MPSLSDNARKYLARLYGWMCLGLFVTGLVALVVHQLPSRAQDVLHQGTVLTILIVSEFVLVVVLSAMLEKIPPGLAVALFIVYAVLNGVVLSAVFLAFTTASVATAFFVTAAGYGAMSLYGTFAGGDLSGWQSVGILGTASLLLGALANLGLNSKLASWITTYAGVIIFLVVTAVNAQKVRALAQAESVEDRAKANKQAISGALLLYLDFITLFFTWINLLAKRRQRA